MKTAVLFSVALLSLSAGSAMAQTCDQGAPPALIDGSTATEAQMAETMKAVKAYIVATEEYQACLEAAGRGGKVDVDAYNRSAARMEALAADFNKQLKTFKARNG